MLRSSRALASFRNVQGLQGPGLLSYTQEQCLPGLGEWRAWHRPGSCNIASATPKKNFPGVHTGIQDFHTSVERRKQGPQAVLLRSPVGPKREGFLKEVLA